MRVSVFPLCELYVSYQHFEQTHFQQNAKNSSGEEEKKANAKERKPGRRRLRVTCSTTRPKDHHGMNKLQTPTVDLYREKPVPHTCARSHQELFFQHRHWGQNTAAKRLCLNTRHEIKGPPSPKHGGTRTRTACMILRLVDRMQPSF